MLINEKPKDLVDDYIENYLATQETSFDVDYIRTLLKNYFAYHNGKKQYKDQLQKILILEERWYQSSCTDFSVYDDDYYFIDIWLCFVNFSRKYLRSLVKPNTLNDYGNNSFIDISKNVRTVIDLGCGVGYSTASLKQLYPNSVVTGTNLENTKQWKFCQYMSKRYNFNLCSDINNLHQEQDLVFASEYFEHIKNPIQHLNEVLRLNPKMLVLANAFNTVALGHFTEYLHDGEVIDQKFMSKIFNKHLRDSGYIKLKTKFWNNRPNVWIKQ